MQKKFVLSPYAIELNGSPRFVAIPVVGLNPEMIKSYYHQQRSVSSLKKNDYLNRVADAFGIYPWGKYDSFYVNSIVPFLDQHGLIFYAPDLNRDLLNNRFTLRSVADRLFFSGRPIPKAIFTGYSCDIDHEHSYNPSVVFEKPSKSYDETAFEINVDLLIPHKHHMNYLSVFKNLLGDVFILNHSDEDDCYIATTYPTNGEKYKITDSMIEEAKELKKLLLHSEKGWIEIIPFNENLIFLKGSNGIYDFVFKHLRDSDFEDQSPFRPYLNHDRIPSVMNETYDFARWLYFGRKEDDSKKKQQDTRRSYWLEELQHHADIDFYESGGGIHPGYENLLKNYFEKIGEYSYIRKTKPDQLDGLHEIKLSNGKELFVSDLITIREFSKFDDEESPDVKSYRVDRHPDNDIWETVNFEPDDYPVAVTYYDAVAYCRWFELKHKAPVRLLSADEWYEIFENPHKVTDLNGLNRWTDDLICFTPASDVIEDITKYRNDFQEVYVRFKNPPEMIPQSNGLKLCINHHFSEWLLEFNGHDAAMVTPALMKPLSLSFLSDDELSTPSFSARSTGKYKYQKIGFRICYEK
ncbi:SUMF1/EgtB/PvdO family nonheme iron enzyme [Sulfuricurvum sp.]|uniref:SUMF1/EgtB/PvdO family nonheme iron enzyme n=1 Tax=Sulfuricurvum sp. TaxID=2025608 RepID=UPI0026315BE1|nr:SUMF1/EgtB/PvdO family nonheme iron enzyme [Sulfuricurvum sp.]MDD3594928.1 SUMF1/EgtB/PvdO family nonheme iron enzyme [Sulfuricurvum sp.]